MINKKTKLKKYRKQYYEKNKDLLLKKRKQYIEKNKEEIAAKNKEYNKRTGYKTQKNWNKRNRVKAREYEKRYRIKRGKKDFTGIQLLKEKEYQKQYYQKNKEKIKAQRKQLTKPTKEQGNEQRQRQ